MWPAITRMLSIMIGFAISGLVQILVLPVFARRQLTEALAAALEHSVALIYEQAAAAQGGQKAQQGCAGGGAGGSAAAGERTAVLQRAQRKQAAALDGLLGPTAVVSLSGCVCCGGLFCRGCYRVAPGGPALPLSCRWLAVGSAAPGARLSNHHLPVSLHCLLALPRSSSCCLAHSAPRRLPH